MEQHRFLYLLAGYTTQTITVAEKQELLAILSQPETVPLGDWVSEYWQHDPLTIDVFSIEDLAVQIAEVLSVDQTKSAIPTAELKSAADILSPALLSYDSIPPVHRIHFFKTAWFRYAAAAILIISGAAGYLLLNSRNAKEQVIITDNNRTQTDILPGGERAILTLADGRTIILDSAANGQLANQGGVKVVKLANGQVAYDLQDLHSQEVMWNTMSTPKGGQYKVTLPDGTRVWLNAASSIIFPVAFKEANRTVKIKGELYFEVARNKQQPFFVDVDGKSVIEVLGTSFNVNSYQDEGSIKTTLLEGSVKVSYSSQPSIIGAADQRPASPGSGSKKASVILQPGQQAVVEPFARPSELKNIGINIQPANLEQALAWKNGLFNFNGLNVKEVMSQLERWYDIQVRYEGEIPGFIFRGKMYRGASLSKVLMILEKMEVKFRMEGKTLVVL